MFLEGSKWKESFLNHFLLFSNVQSQYLEGAEKEKVKKNIKQKPFNGTSRLLFLRLLKGFILDILPSPLFLMSLYDYFHRFNSIWSRHGSRYNPQCNSIRTECYNDVRLWAGRRWSLLGEMVQREAWILPLHAEGNSIDKDFQVTWYTGRCKLMHH